MTNQDFRFAIIAVLFALFAISNCAPKEDAVSSIKENNYQGRSVKPFVDDSVNSRTTRLNESNLSRLANKRDELVEKYQQLEMKLDEL